MPIKWFEDIDNDDDTWGPRGFGPAEVRPRGYVDKYTFFD